MSRPRLGTGDASLAHALAREIKRCAVRRRQGTPDLCRRLQHAADLDFHRARDEIRDAANQLIWRAR